MTTRTPNPDAFLTITDIAAELGLCTKTVNKHLTEGKLPGIKVGTIWRIPVAQWAAFKEGRWQPRQSKATDNVQPITAITTRRSA